MLVIEHSGVTMTTASHGSGIRSVDHPLFPLYFPLLILAQNVEFTVLHCSCCALCSLVAETCWALHAPLCLDW